MAKIYLVLTSAVAINGAIHNAGSVIEVSEAEAKNILARGKARLATADDDVPPAADPPAEAEPPTETDPPADEPAVDEPDADEEPPAAARGRRAAKHHEFRAH